MASNETKMDDSGLKSLGDFLEFWHIHREVIVIVVVSFFSMSWVLYSTLPTRRTVKKVPKRTIVAAKPVPIKPVVTSDGKPEAPSEAQSEAQSSGITARGPRRIKGELRKPEATRRASDPDSSRRTQILVFYSSLTTTTEKIATDLARNLDASLKKDTTEHKNIFFSPTTLDLAEIDYDNYFISPPKTTDSAIPIDYFYLFLIPSYNIDTTNDNLLEHLQETHHDFRIDTAPLSGLLGYSVFGLGDREGWPTEEEGFCFQAKEVDKWMAKLTGRKRAYPLGMGDKKQDLASRLGEWIEGVVDVLILAATTGSLGEGVPGSGDADESDFEYASGDDDDSEILVEESAVPKNKANKRKANIDDVEDIGRIMKSNQADSDGPKESAPIAVDFTTYNKPKARKAPQTVKEMVPKTSPTYTALTKQGYSIVGSHSGVKICRWTKSALRGRGSCYKYSFYGIASHQCMETTPSLSCSNKCVFCWRHGTNPVGTTWRWVVDPPEMIFTGVKAGHYQKIKMMRGVPGVRAERFAEAMRIRHCALSLVGEPIFYPHINEFLAMLHAERISSFLVCNAQHPDQLAALRAVTQLYVSIDASNRESLRKIDRPLHRDFWERFQRCLDILREKRFKHRTVFRLTLVKGFNVDDEVDGYADLVERGLPCFVEIKGVTYCGTSTSAGAGLSMANVPFYAEVTEFVTALDRKLKERGLDYGIAAEHAHSCCVLIASGRFRVDGKWHTRIDYQRFFELLEERGADGDWKPEDYMGPETPEWATWGNGGFDPRDERVDRKGRKIEAS
ncbi:putative wyosine base formation [Rosellinia necatrix]|uniref:S-adenosyl-L-methionine-dependent tRNA 4-demethylwyosine synthase n=1 Tax=Rosellinia necatrix TaxID=77044 RepID=A0A1S7UJU9_ROSNE|nr:putative wyosine base formation [Rosellinia necatrix]